MNPFASLRTVCLLFGTAGLLCGAAKADIERIAQPCDRGVCFRWWPKLQPPEGWQHDRGHSLHYNFNALAPQGANFADAETVMYANAVYKPRASWAKTLKAYIEGDHMNFRRDSPGIAIRPAPSLKTADGKLATSWTLEPKTNGQWERVAYFEEGEYYMVFVVSSRNRAGVQANQRAFESLVSGYRE